MTPQSPDPLEELRHHSFCPGCRAVPHGSCDPYRRDAPGLRLVCACWACLPNDHEEDPMTEPDQPEPTDNSPKPEDGEQDVSQDPELDYTEVSEEQP